MNKCQLSRVFRVSRAGGESQPRRAGKVFGRLSRLIGLTLRFGVVIIGAALTASAQGQYSVTLAWDPSAGGKIAGYRLYEGGASRTYTNQISVGNLTTNSVGGLALGATYFFAVTAVDTNGLESDYSSEISYTVPLSTTKPPVTAGLSLWPSTAAPGFMDAGADNPVELGVKFRSDVAGSITGIRFYKGSANTGTHVGNLWTSTGALLATATFTGETASGWEQVNFATPVAIAANTVYVASYHANSGHYSYNDNFFSAAGVDNATLHALANSTPGGNGVYAYGASSVFPNLAYNARNYWVDVVWQASLAPTLASIAVTPANPSILAGSKQQFAATGTYSDGSTTNLTSQAAWTSSSAAVATINASGLATAVSAGSTTLSAALNGVTGGSSLTVTAVPPTVALTAPANGASYGAPATIGLAATVTANGHTISKVQFYNGATLLAEDTSAPYTNVWTNVTAGSYSLTARAVYDSSSTITSSSVGITVTSGTSVVSLWPNTAVPKLIDAGSDKSVELGVKFRSDAAGSITGIRFYKGSGNTGTHVGSLWTSTGALLATATFSGETASGWQQVNFATPVAIASNTLYVASYHASSGHYSYDDNYFAVNGVDNLPLHAPNNSAGGGNGAYAYGSSSIFPNMTYNARNYWVDVVWQTGATLPAPWQTMDIGSVGAVGNASVSGGICAVAGAGSISGTADSFRFLYQTMSGDGQIQARISSAQNTGTAGSIALMIRESLTSGSDYASTGILPTGAFRWQGRDSSGGTTTVLSSGTSTPPNAWARLVRTNGIFYGYTSTNGSNWTLLSSRTINMATNIFVGLAVASGTSNVVNTSTFTNVSVIP